MAEPRHLILGTAGHIDHGKSALVHRLTGVDPDRLKEEKARGITIELGFADLELDAERIVSFVDVPGHERFVRHMVAGAAGIDAVLLVIAIDEGVKPQTREHLEICRLLGLRSGLVALTKSDLVDDELAQVAEMEVREYLTGSFLEDADPVQVSAQDGRGLAELRRRIGALFEAARPRRRGGVARLPVDRSFVQRGFGTVVTGSLVSGELSEGDEVEVLPGGRRGRVRGLQVHRTAVRRAHPGRRTAVNLQGLDCSDVPRGSTIAAPERLRTTRRVWARVDLLPGVPDSLRRGGPVRFHQGTCERQARLRVRGHGAAGESYGELFLGGPTVLAPGDRFVLRRPAPVNTVGGGVVLDAHPPRGRVAGERIAALDGLDPHDTVDERLTRAGAPGRAAPGLAAELGWSPHDLERVLASLRQRGRMVLAGGRLFSAATWSALEQATLREVEAFHERSPLETGVSREDLRGRAAPQTPQDAFRTLLERLAAAGRIRAAADLVALPGHRVVLSEGDLARTQRIEAALLTAGLDPPGIDEILADDDPEGGRRLVELLARRGRLVRMRDGRWFHAEAVERLVRRLREYAQGSPTIDVGEFKRLAGVTRKNAIPLLEHLDECRLTRRRGNLREILDVAPEEPDPG